MSDFAAEATRYVRSLVRDVERAAQEATVEMCDTFIEATPVFKGNEFWGPPDERVTQENWQSSLDSPIQERVVGSQGMAKTMLRGVVFTQLVPKEGRKFFFTNNDRYIENLEYGLYHYKNPVNTINGFSTQAPLGIVRANIDKWDSIIAEKMALYVGD